jgi:Mg-chelatase subunit ChlD
MNENQTEVTKRPISEISSKMKERIAHLQKVGHLELEEECCILIDVSGSMGGTCGSISKLEAAKQAIPLLQAINHRIKYSLIAFGDHATTMMEATTNFNSIIRMSETLLISGSTNMTAAIREGLAQMEDAGEWKLRMIILSDGQPNVEADGLDKIVGACVEKRIAIDTIAFGKDANEQLLMNIASRTGGQFHRADSPLALQNVYRKLNYDLRYLTNHTVTQE